MLHQLLICTLWGQSSLQKRKLTERESSDSSDSCPVTASQRGRAHWPLPQAEGVKGGRWRGSLLGVTLAGCQVATKCGGEFCSALQILGGSGGDGVRKCRSVWLLAAQLPLLTSATCAHAGKTIHSATEHLHTAVWPRPLPSI